jgi:L-aminopeptidase/D-esterase-like protein
MATIAPGLRNLISDVGGITVGNAQNMDAVTGTTVVLMDEACIAAVDVRGGGPATRETDLLSPDCAVEQVDAICLSGGSVYGLVAADGVVRWLADQGRGYPVGPWRAPIVPSACIFDLEPIGGPMIMSTPLYGELASLACDSAGQDFELGNVGAGTGARAGMLKGGLGSASVVSDDGLQVAAIAVANPVGSVVMPGSSAMWAWPFEQVGEFGSARPASDLNVSDVDLPYESRIGGNTSLAVVATNAPLNKAAAKRVSLMAHDGFARAIRPVHTPFDGDTIFTVATGALSLDTSPLDIARIGAMAADCVARAIARGVYEAEDLGGIECYRSSYQLK